MRLSQEEKEEGEKIAAEEALREVIDDEIAAEIRAEIEIDEDLARLLTLEQA